MCIMDIPNDITDGEKSADEMERPESHEDILFIMHAVRTVLLDSADLT